MLLLRRHGIRISGGGRVYKLTPAAV